MVNAVKTRCWKHFLRMKKNNTEKNWLLSVKHIDHLPKQILLQPLTKYWWEYFSRQIKNIQKHEM